MQRGFFERIEQDYRLSWEQIRWQAYISVLPHVKKGSLNKPEDLIKFTWDMKENPAMTEQEQLDFIKRMGTKIENGKFVN